MLSVRFREKYKRGINAQGGYVSRDEVILIQAQIVANPSVHQKAEKKSKGYSLLLERFNRAPWMRLSTSTMRANSFESRLEASGTPGTAPAVSCGEGES